MENVDKRFEDFLLQTMESDEAVQNAGDNQLLQEIYTERKKIKISGVPFPLIFEYPDIGLSLIADRIVAEFRAKELRIGKLLTNEQLKAIASRPMTIEENGKNIVISKPQWSEKDEQILAEYPRKINDITIELITARQEYQEANMLRQKIQGEGKDAEHERAKADKRKQSIYDQAYKIFDQQIKLKKQLLETQLKEMQVVNGSLEDISNIEKIKYLAPKCIKKVNADGSEEFLWKTDDEFTNAPFSVTTVLSVFNVFLRGGDISFFGVLLEDQTN